MLAMPLILTICAANFAIGFVLAVRNGHGPVNYGLPASMYKRLPAFLRQPTADQHAHTPAAH
jgi:hypothetical protein